VNDILPFVVIGLTAGSVYGLAGVGLVLTYKTSGLFNFAYGTIAAALAFAFYDLNVTLGVPWPIALPICVIGLGVLAGFGMELLSRRLADAPAATKIVATLGILVAIQQLAIIRYGPTTLQMPSFLPSGRIRVVGVNVDFAQLVVMGVALAATVALSLLFRYTRLGLGMRGVVDNAELLSLTGKNPIRVRRWSWCIGCAFAALSGILLAPTIGLDATILTLLVVQAFGAAAIGGFRSLPLTYVGGLAVGVLAALSTKYVGDVPWLMGLPSSVPFLVLFLVLVLAPRGYLRDVTVERRRRVPEESSRSLTRRVVVAVGGLLVLVALPFIATNRILTLTNALVFVVIFLSLALLERMSGLVSLAQLAFAAVGAATFAHLATDAGLPWLPAVLLAGLITVPVGAIVAIPAIRLSGLYLALATFGFAILMERMVFGTDLLFGSAIEPLRAPRPSIATSDRAYYYVVLIFVVAAVAIVGVVHRSRLGRLLRAMADEQTALSTFGTNVTALKVIVFAIASFLAGIAGALLGPVTGVVNGVPFAAFASLMLVVVLAIQGHVREVRAAFGAAATLIVLPSLLQGSTLAEYLSPLFGVAAVVVALVDAGSFSMPRWRRNADERAHARVLSSPGRSTIGEDRTSSVSL
jgi:branched-subunit amino acid ABC-type transport system permease component